MPGVSKAKSLARILALVLCSCLLCDSPSELQKAQGLFAEGSLAEVVTVFRQVVQDDRSNPDAHLLLGLLWRCRVFVFFTQEIETAINSQRWSLQNRPMPMR